MSRIINFDLPDGGVVSIETQDMRSSGQVMRGGPTDITVKAAHNFADAVSIIQPVASLLVTKFQALGHGLDAIDLKFGLKFSAEAGAIIASASSEANIEVRISWHKPNEKV